MLIVRWQTLYANLPSRSINSFYLKPELTLFVAVDLSHDDLCIRPELLGRLVGRLVPDGRQHVAEAAPVRVKVDEHELIVRWK